MKYEKKMGRPKTPHSDFKICSECNENKLLSEFGKSNRGALGVLAKCKKCVSIYNHNRFKKIYSPKLERTKKLKRLYNLTEIEYDKMLKDQDFKCAICKDLRAYKNIEKPMHVDHCHKTGKIRGLLCGSCNRALGYFRDDVELLKKAKAYLENR